MASYFYTRRRRVECRVELRFLSIAVKENGPAHGVYLLRRLRTGQLPRFRSLVRSLFTLFAPSFHPCIGVATFLSPDHLSNRAETDSSGNVIRSFGHFPLGEVWYETPATDKWKFTTYNEIPKAVWIMQALVSIQLAGRFTSPDPLPGYLSNPESLNRYSYVTNDPVNFLIPQVWRRSQH